MASLTENRPLLFSLLVSASVVFVLASGLFPDLSAMFEIEVFTEEVSTCRVSFFWWSRGFLSCLLVLFVRKGGVESKV